MQLRSIAALLVACVLATSCGMTPSIRPTEAALATRADMSRDDAIARLAAETFLPLDKAACVVDAVFLNAGVYNPKSGEAQAAVDQAALVASCTETDDDFEVPDPDQGGSVQPVEELQVETGTIERIEPYALTDATMPVFAPGAMASGSVEIGGKIVDYVTITPNGFEVGSSAPVLFALPPGGQEFEITKNVAEFVYLNEAVRRGWVVVSPASPGGRWFHDNNTAIVPEFMRWISAWVTVEGGRPHLGGMSNGGISAFHIAAQDPSAFRSLMAYPGFPDNQADKSALASFKMPVRMWVGGEDTQWVNIMETTAESLRNSGGDVELFVLPGEPHVLQSTSDGVAIFDALDSAR